MSIPLYYHLNSTDEPIVWCRCLHGCHAQPPVLRKMPSHLRFRGVVDASVCSSEYMSTVSRRFNEGLRDI